MIMDNPNMLSQKEVPYLPKVFTEEEAIFQDNLHLKVLKEEVVYHKSMIQVY